MGAHHHLIASSRIEGAPVFNAAGERLGSIDDVMLDKATGKAVYALMSFDGFLGVGARFYPLPWTVLTYDPDRNGYVVPLARADIEKGHAVEDKEVEDEIQWREQVHAYYGVSPYWIGSPVGY